MDFEKFYIALGKNIKKQRELVGLTQEALAEKAGISQDYLGKIEVNINKPGLKTIFRLAWALGIPIKDLFDFK